MNTAPLATVASATLADAVADALAAAFRGRQESCLWCGSAAVQVVSADLWSGSVSLRCPHCGMQLEGVVPRERREVRR